MTVVKWFKGDLSGELWSDRALRTYAWVKALIGSVCAFVGEERRSRPFGNHDNETFGHQRAAGHAPGVLVIP